MDTNRSSPKAAWPVFISIVATVAPLALLPCTAPSFVVESPGTSPPLFTGRPSYPGRLNRGR